MKTQYPDFHLLGLIFLTEAQTISDKADPSDLMYFGTQSQMKKLWEDFFKAIDRIKTLAPIEKVVEANKIGTLAEWTPQGIFKRLVTKRCK